MHRDESFDTLEVCATKEACLAREDGMKDALEAGNDTNCSSQTEARLLKNRRTAGLHQQTSDKARLAPGYSPPDQNLLPRHHVIGSRARYEIQTLDSAFHAQGQVDRAKEEPEKNLFSGLFRRERRPSDKHREFVDMLQFPKGNK